MRVVAGALLVAAALALPAFAAEEPTPYVRTCSSSAYGDLGAGWRERAVVAGHLAFVGMGGPRRASELDPVDPGRANPLKVLVVVDPNTAPTLTIARVSRSPPARRASGSRAAGRSARASRGTAGRSSPATSSSRAAAASTSKWRRTDASCAGRSASASRAAPAEQAR